jgi:methylase of polypeptide subunit release factors
MQVIRAILRTYLLSLCRYPFSCFIRSKGKSRHWLKPRGKVWLETDPVHPPIIQALLAKHPEFALSVVRTHTDFAERPRFVELQLNHDE